MPVTPLQAAESVLTRAENMLGMDSTPHPPITREDFRRMALAMGVAAIDTQMHWLVRGVDLRNPLSKELKNIPIHFEEMLSMAQNSVDSRRAGVTDRPTVRARNALNDALLRMTFQSARQVENALAMAGIKKGWNKLTTAMAPDTSQDIRDHLNRLSHRRNLIVHEGDLKRAIRPSTLQRADITRSYVRGELDWIRRLLIAVNSIS